MFCYTLAFWLKKRVSNNRRHILTFCMLLWHWNSDWGLVIQSPQIQPILVCSGIGIGLAVWYVKGNNYFSIIFYTFFNDLLSVPSVYLIFIHQYLILLLRLDTVLTIEATYNQALATVWHCQITRYSVV